MSIVLRSLALACCVLLGSCVTTTDVTTDTQSLFDGSSLAGWDGDPAYWSVEGGVIVGRATADTPLDRNTFLVWTGGDVGDFELRLDVRLVGNNNSGIQYRSARGDGFVVKGYQCDLHPRPEYNGMLYEEGGRGIIATQGQSVRIAEGGEKTPIADPRTSLEFANDRWHQVTIVARGPWLTHRIDGADTVLVEDHQEGHAARSGVLALQLHAGQPYEVRFQNIRLTRLDDAGAGSTAR